MKKSAKLLSVLLAILMIFSSVSVLASAQVAKYKTTQQLEDMQAYGTHGEVTRLTTEERLSILADSIDALLKPLDIFYPDLIKALLPDYAGAVGLILYDKIYIDARSIDGICNTLDKLQGQLANTKTFHLGGVVNMTNLGGLHINAWHANQRRGDKTASHTQMLKDLCQVLSDAQGIIGRVLTEGIKLNDKTLNNLVGGALAPINKTLINLSPVIKGLIFPLFQRVDDTREWAFLLKDAANDVKTDGQNIDHPLSEVVDKELKFLLTKSQKYTVYKEDAQGNCVSNHVLPTADSNTRVQFLKQEDGSYKVQTLDMNSTYEAPVYLVEKDAKGQDNKYTRTPEVDAEGKETGLYIYQDAVKNAIMYHTTDDVWVQSFADDVTLDMNGANTKYNLRTRPVIEMFYDAVPFIFKDLAPIVLNGSVKKLLAEWFGAKFTYIADVTDNATLTKELGADYAVGGSNDAIFTKEHAKYTFDWSDYDVLKNGTHVWRFKDQIWKGDLTNINPYFNIFNWNYKIDNTFFDEFMPATSHKATLLQSMNNFVFKFIELVMTPEVVQQIGWVKGENTELLQNAKRAAQAIVKVSPESIFGEHCYADPYFNYLMDPARIDDTDNQGIVCIIAAELLKLLMPQLVLPSVEQLKGQSVGAMFAYIIREVTTQLLPSNDYDALIFTNYNTRELLTSKDNQYWLDVCLTMGIDLGMHYLASLCDMGNDDTVKGYFARFPEGTANKKLVYDLAKFESNTRAWEAKLDWLIDFAMGSEEEWCWNGNQIINVKVGTLAADEDPWAKLQVIFDRIGIFDDIFNVTESKYQTWLENGLRDQLVIGLLDLDLTKLFGGAQPTGLLNIPSTSMLRTMGLFPMVEKVVLDLLNNLFWDLNGQKAIVPTTITNMDNILLQSNLIALVQNILTALPTAIEPVMIFAAPILNNAIGWKVKRQELNDPVIRLVNSDHQNYIYTGTAADGQPATNTIVIKNNVSGMLFKHPDKTTGAVYDMPYVMHVTNVIAKSGTLDKTAQILQPGDEMEITYTANAKDAPELIEVQYYFTLKDGSESKPQTAYFYSFVTNQKTNLNQATRAAAARTTGTWEWGKNVFYNLKVNPTMLAGQDLDQTLKSIAFTIENGYEKDPLYVRENHKWDHYENMNPEYITAAVPNNQLYNGQKAKESLAIYPMIATPGAPQLESGVKVKLGDIKITVEGHGALGTKSSADLIADFGYLHVLPNLAPLQALFDGAAKIQKANVDLDAVAKELRLRGGADQAWKDFQTVMLDTAQYLKQPMMQVDFFDVTGPNNSKYAKEEVQKNFDALNKFVAAFKNHLTGGDIQALKASAAQYADLNYQNYEFFKYKAFDDERQWNNRIIAQYDAAPVAPDMFINGNNMSEKEIRDLAAKETNTKVQSAIVNSLQPVTQAMEDAYTAAKKAYRAPSYTDLALQDANSKIAWYAKFMENDTKTADNTFIAKEIASATAKNYVQEQYSKMSWANYSAALAKAKDARRGKVQSEMFDAKYELMLAQNKLVPAEVSAKDNGYYAPLEALIQQAEAVFADGSVYSVKANVDTNKAYADLLEALGYEYANGAYTQNLYPNSAKAFVATDRMIGKKTDAAINAQMEALKAALANFEASVKLVANDAQTKVDAAGAFLVDGINPGAIKSVDDLTALVKVNTNGYTLEVVASNGNGYGTGSQIVIKAADGKALSTYTVVIYGDVNGDGVIDAFDLAEMNRATRGEDLSFTGAYALAADADRNSTVDALADYTTLKAAVTKAAPIVQA